jgi:DNA-binding NarL/FixJ family response regulator
VKFGGWDGGGPGYAPGGGEITLLTPDRRTLARDMPSVISAKFEDLVAVGLKALIAEDPNLELVASDVPMEELEKRIAQHAPAVALLNFGTLRTPAEVFALHQQHPETRIVVLANRPSAAECNQMLSFGATACLSKETEARDIISAIHLASRGMHVLPRSAAAASSFESLAVEGSDLLTAREAEVLELLQDGATNAQIAHQLSIGVETVRTHARNIYRKLGISSRRELPRLARRDPIAVDGQGRPLGG